MTLTPPGTSPAGHATHRRPFAAFLAHLIATAEKMPQTRARRRAEPEEGANRYIAASGARPAAPGTKLARVL